MEIAYRNNDLYGDGSNLITKVMQHEIFELGNIDIISYMQHYSRVFDNLLMSIMENIISDKDAGLQEKEQQELFCENILHELNVGFNTHYRYCLWLTDMSGMKKHYLDDYMNPDNTVETVLSHISAYETGFILSNLGSEGTLYAYQDMPAEMTDADTYELKRAEYILVGQTIGPIAYLTRKETYPDIYSHGKPIRKNDILSNNELYYKKITSVTKDDTKITLTI